MQKTISLILAMFLLLTSCSKLRNLVSPVAVDPAEIYSYKNKALERAQYYENNLIGSAQDFHCNDVFLSRGVAMKKYGEYLDRISSIEVDYLGICGENYNENDEVFIRKCKKDLRLVFEMSQKDNRLTEEEKQGVVDYVAIMYTFVLSVKNFE